MIVGEAPTFACGPLDIAVTGNSDAIRAKIADTLALYNVRWPGARARWRIDVVIVGAASKPGAGSYLECARMNVDATNDTNRALVATCPSGILAMCDRNLRRWSLVLPEASDDSWILTDIESVLSLVLTEGWREAGWTPIHAAAVLRDGVCAIVCAASGGGKTTLTAALIRRGWKTLGDDKLLLRVDNGQPELRALVHTFNLHPQTRAWFPEVGDLEQFPVYSEWTEKRKVRPESIWPGTTVDRARPNCLLQIERTTDIVGVDISPMRADEVLSALLRQTVIPSLPSVARPALAAIAVTARELSGFNVRIGDDAYLDLHCLESLEAELLEKPASHIEAGALS